MKNGGTVDREQVVREELLRSFDPTKGENEILAADRPGEIIFELHLQSGHEQKETTLSVVGGHSPVEIATQFCEEHDIMLQERPFVVSMILQKYQLWLDDQSRNQKETLQGEEKEKNNQKETQREEKEKNNWAGFLLWPVFTLGLAFVAASFQKTGPASGSKALWPDYFQKPKMFSQKIMTRLKILWEKFCGLSVLRSATDYAAAQNVLIFFWGNIFYPYLL